MMALRSRIEATCHQPWVQAVARQRNVSEYTIYGVYCDHVAGTETSGHYAQQSDLVHSIWAPDELPSAEEFGKGLQSKHIAVHVQSTLSISVLQRRQYMDKVLSVAYSSEQENA